MYLNTATRPHGHGARGVVLCTLTPTVTYIGTKGRYDRGEVGLIVLAKTHTYAYNGGGKLTAELAGVSGMLRFQLSFLTL